MSEQDCPTCGPTTVEQHPRQPVTRCANCKEWLTSVPPTQPPAAKCDYCDQRATTLAGDTNGVLVCEGHVRLFAEARSPSATVVRPGLGLTSADDSRRGVTNASSVRSEPCPYCRSPHPHRCLPGCVGGAE